MREYKLVVLGSGGVGKSALRQKTADAEIQGRPAVAERTASQAASGGEVDILGVTLQDWLLFFQQISIPQYNASSLDTKTVQFVQGIFVEKYDPTIEDSYRKGTYRPFSKLVDAVVYAPAQQVEVDCQQCMLEILDTAGTEQFTAMRDLYMKNGQGFALVYSITAQSTFNDLQDLREQILRVKDTEDVPMILVGNKCDLEDERVVGKEQGQNLARQWNNCAFLESSAKSKINVNEIFYDLVRQINRKAPVEKCKKKKSQCMLL